MNRRRKLLLGVLGILLLLGVGLGALIARWGRPLPKAYQLVEVSPAVAGSGRTMKYLGLKASSAPGHRAVAVDNDGDGTVDVVLREGPVESFNRPAPDDPEARRLVLCVDGVPYEEFAALWGEGYFREFFRPVPLVPPFPTASGVALTSVFHADPVAGYEDGYFDIARNRLSGGALKTTALEDIPFVHLLDYDLPGHFRGPAYMLPRKSFRADLGRFRKRFLASSEKVYLAHIATTDSLYHTLPREEVRELLIEIDALLRELYFEAQGRLRITFFSDHGNNRVPSRPIELKQHLQAGGWRLAARCGEPRAVVVPAYGLMGFFAVYCVGEEKAELARYLARLEGVDFVAYAQGELAIIENRSGRAALEARAGGEAFRYQAQGADPLQLQPLLEQLAAEGKLDAEGWAANADLFAARPDHDYPDAARRVWEWSRNHVRNPAPLVVSLEPGYHHGSAVFERLVRLQSAHGSLHRDQSLGFATSTDAPLAGAIRSEDLLPPGPREK